MLTKRIAASGNEIVHRLESVTPTSCRQPQTIAGNFWTTNRKLWISSSIGLSQFDKLKAMDTHTPTHGFVKPTAWLVPHACAQPYHPGSDTHGQRFRPYRGSSAWHNRRTSVRTKSCWWAPVRAKQLAMAACPGDTAVRMREVLARPWVGECVPLTLSLSLSIWRLKSGHCTSAVSKSLLQGTKTQISCG